MARSLTSRQLNTHQRRKAVFLLPLVTFLLICQFSNAFGLQQSQVKAIRGRATALQALLKLDSLQTDSLEVILRQTFERGEEHKGSYKRDYYGLALKNQQEMDSMRAQVNAILTDGQRTNYQETQAKLPIRYSSRKTEVLARRLLLDSALTPLLDAILSYAERDIKNIKQEYQLLSGGVGSKGRRGKGMKKRTILLKSYEAIEKMLSKAQIKEFKEYQKEQMDEFRPYDNERNHNGGF